MGKTLTVSPFQAAAWRAGGVSAAAGAPRPRTGTTQATGAGHGGGGGYHGHPHHGQVEEHMQFKEGDLRV
jgi:hypothetical protein